MTEENVLLKEQKDGVLWLTLNRPEALNTLNPSLTAALRTTFEELRHQPEIRIVVLKANGRAFCAGLDLSGEEWTTESTPNSLMDLQRSIRSPS